MNKKDIAVINEEKNLDKRERCFKIKNNQRRRRICLLNTEDKYN